jgi:parvulin-like peptidyl-prolyl isomerase
MNAVKRIVRDPLTHFLAGGGILFAVFVLLHGGDTTGTADGKTIVVDRPSLVTFMQYESAAFQPEVFSTQFNAMSAKDRKALVDDYVRQEALVREARAMGLDQGDYVIRRRMVQKMMYLIDDAATQTFSPTEADLQRYFQAHVEAYRNAATVTFTHVFVDKEIKHPGGAQRAAERLKAELEARHAGFQDAPGYGDRFAYLRNYVQRTPDFVVNQFGAGFASAVMKLQPSSRWQGPIESDYGYHLVLLTQKTPAALPKLAEVRDQVKDDLLRETIAAYRDKALADLTRRFTVKLKGVSLAPAGPTTPK